mmetsp:Transcript_41202/g.92529  ORF Transcript_41202/g.92529 Transcript_41202/m.92529 type:complete len:166 (-) Transcript_41202:15-512(-)
MLVNGWPTKHVLFGTPELDDSGSSCSSNEQAALVTRKLKNVTIVSSDGTAGDAEEISPRSGSVQGQRELEKGHIAVWSKGSALHDEGGCKACAHYATRQICNLGAKCDFCHLCTFAELQRRRKERVKEQKKKKKRSRQQQWRQASPGDGNNPLTDANTARPSSKG